MVAEECDGTTLHIGHHGFNDEDRIGAVSHIIAQKHMTVDPVVAGMVEAGGERLPVAVNIGEERDPHQGDPQWPDGNVSLSLTVVKCIDRPQTAGRAPRGPR